MVLFLIATAGAFIAVLLRYFFIAGAAHYLCTVWKPGQIREREIDPEYSRARSPDALKLQIRREIKYSVLTCFIFGLAGSLLMLAWQKGYTRVYTDVSEYGWSYLFLSFWIAAFLHETYFYWVHRWMHQPRIFKAVHRVHHESKSPTAWAAFSFHPWETLLEALILPLIVILIPLHPVVLIANLLLMSVTGVLNHTGFELYHKAFARHFFWRHWISATHHHSHHSRFNYNYGLYFTFWDRLMKTQHSDYENQFERIHARHQAVLASVGPAISDSPETT